MSSILDSVQNRPIRQFSAGEAVIEEGTKSGLLFVLIEGSVEVLKGEVRVARASEPGVVFGDLSALLGGNHSASVRTLTPSSFHVVENPRQFLEESPPACLHLCELMARRLCALNNYLVDVKQQFEGDDHLGMVDTILETLMHREPRPRVRPSESTLLRGELSS